MTNVVDVIIDYSPPASGVNVPLQTSITMSFNRSMDTTRLEEDFFLEGPDTDQYVGPGLIELRFPDNISQGDLDDFLMSPGYKGIAEGSFAFEEVSGVGTKMTFTPTRPLAPSFEYRAYLGETLDADGNTLSGQIYWSFQTGTGSIEELPSTISSSILAAAPQAQGVTSQYSALAIVKTTPTDHSIEQKTNLAEIVVEFNKNIAAGVSAESILVEASPATDHPACSGLETYDLAKAIEVIGKQLKIKI